MNAVDRASLDAIPTPVDENGAVRCCVVEDRAGGWRTAWALDGGLRKQPFGPSYATGRDAAQVSRYLNERAAA